MRKQTTAAFSLMLLITGTEAIAGYKDDIGHTQLQTQLGISTPTGTGVSVVHVEAKTGDHWQPDTSDAQFSSKTFTRHTSGAIGTSGHATSVGKLFYGNTSSIAPGISDIDTYLADDWLDTGFLHPMSTPLTQPNIADHRVGNHSYAGSSSDPSVQPAILDILKRVDWLAERDDMTNVVGIPNSGSPQPLLGSAFNVIAVGKTSGDHAQGSVTVNADTIYTGGRTRPHVVAPPSSSSSATPVVAATAATLIETVQDGALSLSNGSTTNRNGDTIYNGERSEVIKAAIMAGADRSTNNTSTTDNITDYRSAGNTTANGLDNRFGAGQVNVFNSYTIIAAGEQDSQEDAGNSDPVGMNGFDYDLSFGGDNSSNAVANYAFHTLAQDSEFTASLVWNIGNSDASGDYDGSTELFDMDLALFDQTDLVNPIASSNSSIDNTENLWVMLEGGHDYLLRVESNGTFDWDYGVAWRTSPVPVPAAVWLFGTGLAALASLNRRWRTA